MPPCAVPTSSPSLLGVAHHLLINELRRSPRTVLDGILALAQAAIGLDTGTIKSSTSVIILYGDACKDSDSVEQEHTSRSTSR